MRAITVIPGKPDSVALTDVAEAVGSGSIVARTIAIGICGTDHEILSGAYGWTPPDAKRLVIGHESLLQVVSASEDSDFSTDDFIVGIVRRPDPEPCRCCAAGEWDMCLNGRYTERGIKALDGYAAEQIRIEPEFAVKVDTALGIVGVLLEPASVVAKAWDHVYRIGARSRSWKPQTALITGAGPVGLLAAMMAVQRGLKAYVFDRVAEGLKPALAQTLGAHYIHGDPAQLAKLKPDVIIECTGAAPLIIDALQHSDRDGIMCLAGVSSGGHHVDLDIGQANRQIVLENDVVFGSVNANRSHYEMAATALADADRDWLTRLISRRVPLSRWQEAYEHQADDVKVVLDFTA